MKKIFFLILVLLFSTKISFSQEILTLKKAVQIALDNNKDLVTIKNNIAIQEFDIKVSRGSLLPDLSFSTGWNKTNTVSKGGLIFQNGIPVNIPDENSTRDNFDLSLTSQVTLFNGFANYQTIELGNQTVEFLNLQYEKLKKDIIILVNQRYFDLLKKTYIVKANEDNLKNSQDQLESIKEFVNVGKKTISEIYKQDVLVAQNELNLESSMNDEKKAKVDLLLAMYSDVDLDFELDLTELPATYSISELKIRMDKYGNLSSLTSQALSNRYDYKGGIQDIKLSEIKLSLANKYLYWPTLSAFGNYNTSGNTIDEITNTRVLSVGLSLNYTIFQGFNFEVNKEIAEVNIKQKREDLDKLELQIRSDIKKAVIDLQTAYKQSDILDRNIASAEQDVKLSEENYRIGFGTLLDLQTATIALNNLRISKINSIYNFLLAEKQIDYLTGIINY